MQISENPADETESERAYSEASTHAEPFFIPASKRARTLWTEACGGSKNLTIANVEAVCCKNSYVAVTEPKLASISNVPSVCFSNLESRPRYVQPSIQRYATQSRSGVAQPSQTLQQYISVLLNSEEGVDVLKLSCCLGYMASEGIDAARDTLGLDKVEDCVLHLIGRLRKISKEMSSSLQYSIETSNYREIVHAIAVTSLEKYCVNCQFSVDGDSFFWLTANERAEQINSMAVATFCVGIWPFVKETLINEPRFTAKIPEIMMVKYMSRWFIKFRSSGGEADKLFDVSLLHQNYSSLTTGPTCDGGSSSLTLESDSYSAECDLGKTFLLEFLALEYKNFRGKPSKCIRSILEWNHSLDLKLCCFLPFVEFFEKLMKSGCIPSSALPGVQKFICLHENHSEDSALVNDRCLDASDTNSSRLLRALESISSLLEENGRADSCSVADVYSASLAVSSSVDLIFDRLERSSWPSGKLGGIVRPLHGREPS